MRNEHGKFIKVIPCAFDERDLDEAIHRVECYADGSGEKVLRLKLLIRAARYNAFAESDPAMLEAARRTFEAAVCGLKELGS